MNFSHLKYFLMVAEELNITRAAERLYISQQSLSNHIANMERELKVKLFTRSPKLTLTFAGEQLVHTSTQILDLYNQYLTKVGDINRQYLGVLRVGISHTCGLALLPEVLPRFREEFPLAEFSLFEGNSSELEDELSHSRVDLVICFQPILLDEVRTTLLTEQRLMMAVPRSFTDRIFGERADQMREVFSHGADINAFSSMPFVLIKRGNRTRSVVDQYFSRYYFKPNLLLETENTVTTLAMAQAGVGITICPELFLRAMPTTFGTRSQGVDFFPLNDPSTTSKLVAGVRTDRILSHFGERFIELAKEALSDQKTGTAEKDAHSEQAPGTPDEGALLEQSPDAPAGDVLSTLSTGTPEDG